MPHMAGRRPYIISFILAKNPEKTDSYTVFSADEVNTKLLYMLFKASWKVR